MKNFQKRRGFKYYLESKPALILLLILLVLFAWKIFGLIGKLEDTHKNKKAEEAKIEDLEKRKAQLTSDIEKLGTDKGKEEILRQNFGLAKEGEQLIVIVDDPKTTPPQPAEKTSSFWSFLSGWFK